MRDLADALLAVLLAPVCAACQSPLAHPTRGCVCESCWAGVLTDPEPCCQRCGARVGGTPARGIGLCAGCQTVTSLVTRSAAVGPHAGSLRHILHALKYEGRRSLARPIGRLMRERAGHVLGDAAVLVPVPLHRSRLRQRGFNQADDLARGLGLPVLHALRRIRPTAVQAALAAAERGPNVAGAFAATRQARLLRGVTVVLVDDVRTTGASLEACAGALLVAGAAEVRAVTAARVATTPG